MTYSSENASFYCQRTKLKIYDNKVLYQENIKQLIQRRENDDSFDNIKFSKNLKRNLDSFFKSNLS